MKKINKIKGFHKELSDACGRRDIERVQDLIAAGEDLKEPWTVDGYPIALAIESNDLEILRALIEAGMPLYLNTALAIKRYGNVENQTLASLWSPSCHQSIMYLLDQGAAVQTDSEDNAPVFALTKLHDSEAGSESDEFFERLIASGINVDAPWGEHHRLLHLISQGRNRYVPKLIALSQDVNVMGANEFDTPLRCAIIAGSDQAVRALLEKGANADAYASKGKSLLQLAEDVKEYQRHLNLGGQVDRIISLLEGSC
ncbi:hypothetical protein [Metapseudomonas otitidis]|uniref:hypothetical protein n=1 Tax=Metapseudomonas otitidis TaxID=319939 RepID=UPI0013F5B863|nr:hypothetical protein [Pseudomonas otitidis]